MVGNKLSGHSCGASQNVDSMKGMKLMSRYNGEFCGSEKSEENKLGVAIL